MKVYESRPKEDVIIVRTEKGGNDYEFWIVRPVYVGGASKTGTQRVVTDDGYQFTNLSSAAQHILDKQGEEKLAKKQPHRIKKRIKFNGMDMVERGVWFDFCRKRKLEPKSFQNMEQDYMLSIDEAKQLGLKE